MANFTLTWTPPQDASSLNQIIQYKLVNENSWTTYMTIGPAINSYTVTGLQDSALYHFRVLSKCVYGGELPSNTAQAGSAGCPAVTFNATTNSITYSFPNPGAMVTGVTVRLLDSNDQQIDSQNPSLTSSNITGTFSGLQQNTTYKVVIDLTGTVNKSCSPQSVTTGSGQVIETFMRTWKNASQGGTQPPWDYNLYSCNSSGNNRVLLKSFQLTQTGWIDIPFTDNDSAGTHYLITGTRQPGTNSLQRFTAVTSMDMWTEYANSGRIDAPVVKNSIELKWPKAQPFRLSEDSDSGT